MHFSSKSNFYSKKIKDYTCHSARNKTSESIFILGGYACAKRQLLTSTSITRILTFSRIILQHT